MALSHINGRATALPIALIGQAVPMLSRPDLARLVDRLIDRLDELESDADLEPDDEPEVDEPDCCSAGEDGGLHQPFYNNGAPFDPFGDDEASAQPAMLDGLSSH